MAKSKIELEVSISGTDSVEQAENKTKSLKAQLREMKTLLASGTLSTEEFEKLAQAAGELQDRIADVNSTVANLGSDSRRLEGLIGITEGIAGGFAAAQGVAALFGEENEDLQKTMVKLQASMSVVQGLTAINNALQKESAAMLLLSSIQTKALAAGQTFLSLTTMKSVAATYALRGALIATGIGAIVVLVAALAGAFSDVAESTNEATEAQKAFNDKAKELDNISVGAIKRETELNKLRLKLKGETNDKLIDEDIEFLKREQTYLNLQLEDAKKRDYKVKEAKDNLARNLDEIEKLADSTGDIFSAKRKIVVAINKAMELAIKNVPSFDGNTLVALDVSGSMQGQPSKIGSLFAGVIIKSNINADMLVFDDSSRFLSINPLDSLTTIIKSLRFNGGGTDFECIFNNLKKAYDRIIVLSDMQGWSSYRVPTRVFNEYKKQFGCNPYIYSFDLNGYGTSQFPDSQVRLFSGFSEQVLEVMKKSELDKNALLNEVESIEV